MKRLLAALLLALVPPLASAAPRPDEMREIEAGRPVVLRPDRAYLLLRTERPEGVPSIEPILLRVPTGEELARYDAAKAAAFAKAEPKLREDRAKAERKRQAASAAGKPPGPSLPEVSLANFQFDYGEIGNVQSVDDSRALVKGKPETSFLVEVTPGSYVVYGLSYGGGVLKPALHLCFCLGTVGFEAPVGVVTDLGTLLADIAYSRSVIPELPAESGFGPSSDSLFRLMTGTMRPVRPGASVPREIAGATIQPAAYHAIGRFFDPRALGINRMVPVPCVLDARNGRVVDVRTGALVDDHL